MNVEINNLSAFTKPDTESTMALNANRMIGGRTVMPGAYSFDADPKCKITENRIGDSDPRYTIEILSKEGKWVSVNGLLRKTLEDVKEPAKGVTFINPWVASYGDILSLAEALAGKKLTVENKRTQAFSTFYDNENHPESPRQSGWAYPAKEPAAA